MAGIHATPSDPLTTRMTATFAHRPWPLPPGRPRGLPWRFGREVVLGSQPGAPRALQWLLRRHGSITPRRIGAAYLGLCGVALALAAFFHAQGVPLVLALTGVELALVGAALAAFARHAGDHELLTLVGRSLQVRQCVARRVALTEFSADHLNVEPAAGQGSLVELSGRGGRVRVGRHLRPEQRADFARELRLALRQPPAASDPDTY